MGWLTDFFFGKKPSLEVKQPDTLSPEQSNALNQVLAQLTGRSSATTPYTGNLNVGGPQLSRSLAALEQESLNAVNNKYDLSGASDTLHRFQSPNSEWDATKQEDQFINAQTDQAINTFKTRILPELVGSFRGNAAFGSDRATAEMRAGTDLATNLAQQSADIRLKGKNDRANRALGAAGAEGQLATAQAGQQDVLARMLLSAIGARSGIEQGNIERNYGEFVRNDMGDEQNLALLLQAIGIPTKQNVAGMSPGTNGLVQSFLGSTGGSAALMKALGLL